MIAKPSPRLFGEYDHSVPLKNPDLNKDGKDTETVKAELNAPELDEETGKPKSKAIANGKQAHAIAKSLKKAAMNQDGRLALAGDISKLYNGAPPFNQKELDASGQDWRANCSTGFLPSIVDRVTPQMRDPIFRSDLLTHSTLPADIPRSSEKSRKFCEDTTKLVRGWRGWNDHVSLLTQDVVLHGGATPGHLGRDWRPRLFRPDQCFLFDGAEQHASKQQVVVFWQALQVHDFLDLFEDHEAAKIAHYDIKECIKAANQCTGKQTSDSEKTPLEYEDAMREKGRLGYSAENQARTVNLFHVFVREYDGNVALWTVTEENGYTIRNVENCEAEMGVEGMDDVLTMFTLQVGNGKFYGSKGLGRLLANIHICVERGRCLAIDQVYLAGLLILMAEVGDIKNLKPSVNHPFIILQGKVEFAKDQISFSATDWKMLDDMLVGIAENVAGAFLPPNLTTAGSANTKIEAAQKAEREIAVRQGVLGRFFAQFADLMSTIQRRIYSNENLKEGYRIFKERKKLNGKGIMPLARRLWKRLKAILGADFKEEQKTASPETRIADPEAVDCIVGLLEAELTVQEILQLAMAPTGNDVQSNNSERDQATMEFLNSPVAVQNPFYDKKAMSKMTATIAIGDDRAKQIEAKDEPDPNDKVLNTREQIIEFTEMMGGEDMPVADTDNHLVHRQALAPKMGMIVGVLEKSVKGNLPLDPSIVRSAEFVINHYGTHLQKDTQCPPQRAQAEVQVLQSYGGILEQAKKLVEQQAKEAQAQAEAAASATQGAPGGQGGGAGPQGGQNQPGGPEGGQDPGEVASRSIEDATKISGEAHRQTMDERKIALEEQKHALERDKFDHQANVDTVGLATKSAETVQKMADRASTQGAKEAEMDMAKQPGLGNATPG